jgi:hemerythrin-like domain-containing protein
MKVGDRGLAEAIRVIMGFIPFARGELTRHFRKEETHLLDALKPHLDIDSDARCQRLRCEHEALRRDIAALTAALQEGEIHLPALPEIGRRLEAHIRFEERELFPRVEALLSEDEMQTLGARLTAE